MNQMVKKSLSLSPLYSGYMVMMVVIFIWSGFSLTVRAISASPLTSADVAIIRFTIPLIILLPLIPSRLEKIRQLRISDLFLIFMGGLPFFFFGSEGAKTVPAAYVGTILAGTPPLFVAILSFLFLKQAISKKRLISLTLIILGVISMIAGQSSAFSAEVFHGLLFLAAGSLIWALYTLGLKRINIDPISVAIVISVASLVSYLILVAISALPTNFGHFTLQDALPFIIVQGVGVGVIATVGYSFAVAQLGSVKSSTIGSISPALTALLAVPLFNEPLSTTILIGITCTTIGVIFTNRS